jgi:flagellar basal-body rod modification protein FlgD
MAVQTVENQNVLNNYLATQEAQKAAAAAPKKDSSITGLGSDYNTFLKLLTAQLQYQDPTAPTDANEFTKQLVSYSQVEQQIKSNEKLDLLVSGQQKSGVTALLDYMGKYVEADSPSIPLQDGKAQLGYTLPTVADKVTINIKNSAGAVVATVPGETGVGRHYITWDGKNGNVQLPDGDYKYEIVATDTNNKAIAPREVFVLGKVTSIASGPTGASLYLGGIGLSDSKVAALHTGLIATN